MTQKLHKKLHPGHDSNPQLGLLQVPWYPSSTWVTFYYPTGTQTQVMKYLN